ncbi:putative PKS-like protein biosynthetic cluster [Metarhizium rileyi]|uniref:Polyketide synthase 1 n=1 Tax=Metarhizium rileyi (strain RCEF 4871) TaxID=1649241 RepID=A0A5C6G3P5_METRR|nr:putative PKS-like protein biosynthetic cluster [Metarhizium rileyi]
MGQQRHLHLFGDQTIDFVPGLRSLLRIRDGPLLSAFLHKTNLKLRQEITRQSREVRVSLPRFSSIIDLLAAYSTERDSSPILASTLTAIYQLGSFISYYGDGCRPYPAGPNHVVLGICTGQLAASAVASASTVSELVCMAVHAVLIAFRTGIYVTKVRNSLENGASRNKSWSYVVSKLPVDLAASRIEQFSQSTGLPVGLKPYIGTVTPSSITIFGHPLVMKDFLGSPTMTDVKSISVPIFAPYHEPHLYTEAGIEDMLECLADSTGETESKLSVISSATGQPMQASTFRALLHSSLREILRQPLRLDTIAESIGVMSKESAGLEWVISSVGSTASQIISKALASIQGVSVEFEHTNDSSWNCGKTQSQANSSGRADQSRIAIIGYSGRFPEAASPEGLWKILQEGRDVHREIPPDRFDVDAHYDPSGKKKNTSTIRQGCFINEPGVFDSRFFNMSPKEADQSDPAQRLALMTAYEALEMAGVVPDSTPSTQRDRVGVFYGMTSDDWREVNGSQDVGTYYIPGTNRAFTPGRINYFFKFSGPSINVDTACSSSAAAIHLACNSLWRNECDMVVAGGTNIMTNPDNFVGLDKGHFLCQSGNCKTFDDGADGYCRADAVGTVILKRLEDALVDKDPIQAVICGAYTNHSAEAESITRPHIGAQAAIFRRIFNDSGNDAQDVSYIEMHGTGTQAGDAVEMRSVLDVFAGNNSHRSPTQPLYLGSVKANLGHAESGSGVSSLIKLMLMMKNSQIPPHIGIKTKINSGFPTDLEERGIRIAMEMTPWQRPVDGRRMAFLNNFSAAGGNSALLIEDAPLASEVRVSEDTRTCHVVAVSARTAQSLCRNIKRLQEHLGSNPDIGLGDLSYTTTARRMHHNYRLSVTGRTIAEVRTALQNSAKLDVQPIPRKTPEVVFSLTGQGSAYEELGKRLFASFAVFRNEIRHLHTISRSFGFDSFMPLMDDRAVDESVPASPQASQLGLTCFQIALARLWNSFGITPSAVIGHSLGEYAALHLSGVLSARDAVFLVGTRARIMQDRCSAGTHAMLATKAPADALSRVCESHGLEIACINTPDQTVLAGRGDHVEAARGALLQAGIKTTKLNTAFAFHSSQVEPVIEEFETLARGVVFRKPSVPILSPLLTSVVTDEGQIGPGYLARHCRETVNLAGAVRSAVSQSLLSESTICLEIGPDAVVAGMLKASIGPATRTVASVRKDEGLWLTLSKALSTLYQAGLDLEWGEYHRDFDESHQVIPLPAYEWDLKNHWIQYVHNWCLNKGDAPSVMTGPVQPAALAPEYLSATCQKVIESKHGPDKSFVLVESDISHPDLRAVFEAHKVNGAALCPSSVYADIGVTLGTYMSKDNPIQASIGIEVADMATTKPLMMRTPGKPERYRASAEADWASQTAKVVFYSVNAAGESVIEHATCTLRFGDPDAWISEWQRTAYLVRSRMQSLRDAVHNGSCHLIRRGMAYKLFENCVEYGERFRGLEEVYLDSNGHEATARIQFKDKSTCFEANPYYIDSLGHLSGFIMNATEAFDYNAQVFLNHGWESIRCAVKPDADETYYTYAKMQSSDGKMYVGDVYIFRGDDIVGVNRGVAFQAVPRKVLDLLLPKPGQVNEARTRKGANTAADREDVDSRRRTVLEPKKARMSGPSSHAGPSLETSSLIVQAMNIISEETGIPMAEMKNDLLLADNGVDSLMSLTLCERYREELHMEVSSALFMENPTIRDIKRWLGVASGLADVSDGNSSTSSSGSQSTCDEACESTSDMSMSERGSSSSSDIAKICTVLADEIGLGEDEIWDAPSLAELGLDSLLSLTVLGRLRDEWQIDLAADFFSEDSLPGIQKKLMADSPVPDVRLPATATTTTTTTTTSSKPDSRTKATAPMPAATSVVIQGSLRSARKVLFLFPDGSGSATSYAALPRVSPDLALVALNCPYMKRPRDMKCALQDMTAPYLAEVRRRQPHGPYYLGGWSAGGISAYDAAATLMAEGEQVSRLILLDAPNPIGLEKLPERLFHFLTTVGVFGSDNSKPLPEWLLPHFIAFLDALSQYDIKPFKLGTAPPTHILWAADGVYKSTGGRRLAEQLDDTREMKWLLEKRTDFGPNGWDTVIGTERLNMEVLEGANHFTMMEGKQGVRLSRYLARVMEL